MAGIVGENTYKALGVPLYGNSEMRGETTQNMLTFTLSSGTNTGWFMLGRPNVSTLFWGPLSSNVSSAVWGIYVDGGFVALSGASSVKMELNSSGLYAGTTQVITSAAVVTAGFKKTVVESTVGQALTVAQSGTLFVVSSAVGTSMTFDLPTGSDVPGTVYEFWVSSAVAASGDVRIAASSLVAAKIHGYGDGTSAVSTFAAITHATTAQIGSYFARLTAVTSMLWALETNGGYSSVTTLGAGVWIAGSTAA